jgi:hypothetical protein
VDELLCGVFSGLSVEIAAIKDGSWGQKFWVSFGVASAIRGRVSMKGCIAAASRSSASIDGAAAQSLMSVLASEGRGGNPVPRIAQTQTLSVEVAGSRVSRFGFFVGWRIERRGFLGHWESQWAIRRGCKILCCEYAGARRPPLHRDETDSARFPAFLQSRLRLVKDDCAFGPRAGAPEGSPAVRLPGGPGRVDKREQEINKVYNYENESTTVMVIDSFT